MDINSRNNLKRLEEQLFLYNRNVKSTEQKAIVSNRLRQQLLESKAVVKVKRMDAECESLMISLKQRLMLLQNILIPKDKKVQKRQKVQKLKDEVDSNVTFDSSNDDETLSTLQSKQRKMEKSYLKMLQKAKNDSQEIHQADTSAPLPLRRNPRKRRLSNKSYSSTSTSHLKFNHMNLNSNKDERTVSTSGVTYHDEEMSVEHKDDGETPTLHIKIPSLHRGNVHYIILDNVNFARKLFDYRANEVKQQQQHTYPSHSSKTTRSHKKQIKSLTVASLEQLAQQGEDLAFSQLVEDAMAEPCADETLQATDALENINNNLVDNYDSLPSANFITNSQSSQEYLFIQNSNSYFDSMSNTGRSNNINKRSRKNTKRSNVLKKEPSKKRGRPKKKIDTQSQPPTKSNLAKYVELFSNDCEILPGSSTPTASSTRSLPLVTSTTHNFDVVDQLQQAEQQTLQQPITYYIDGDWVNGGPCQLVPTSSISAENSQINQGNVNAPLQDSVNFINNSADSGSSGLTRNLECTHSLPVSIPLSIANLGLQNKKQHQGTQQIQNHSMVQNSFVPIINIQIPSLPNNINFSEPPPAHTHKVVLDLTTKSKTNVNFLSENFCLNQKSYSGGEDCVPLDLSTKNCVTIDTPDEEFIRHLIEESDFNYSSQELRRYESLPHDHDSNKSFKAALDMPLLDFDTTPLTQLVKPPSAIINNLQTILIDKSVYGDSTTNEDSNYTSMTPANPSIYEQCNSEIFHNLLDICPDNQFLNDTDNDVTANNDFNESAFNKCTVQNSTMYEVANPITQKDDSKEGKQDVFNTSLEEYKQEIENNAVDKMASSIQFDSSNVSIKFNISNCLNSPNGLQKTKLTQINVENTAGANINSEIANHGQKPLTEGKDETFIEPPLNNTKSVQDTCEMLKCKKQLKDNSGKCPICRSMEDKENSIKTNEKYLNSSTYTYIKDSAIFKSDQKTSNAVDHTNMSNENCTLFPKESCFKNCASLENNELKVEFTPMKPKENIVFSVTKINLSEDDNLFLTDSDSSCDLNKNIKNQTDKNSSNYSYNITSHKNDIKKSSKLRNFEITNSDCVVEQNIIEATMMGTENIENLFIEKINLNLSCKESKKVDNEVLDTCNNENEVMQTAEDIKTTKNSDYTEAATINCDLKKQICDSRPSNIYNTNLTPIDLDSKLNDSLDFDEDLDDALSLTTSCFNSPIDDRFEDSFDYVDTTNTSQNLENPIQKTDLKNFVIPKINNLQISISEIIPHVQKEIKLPDLLSTNPLPNIQIAIETNQDKIIRKIKNDSAQEKDKTIFENVILKVFGITCLPYLVDKCYAITPCQLSHQLIGRDEVYKNLNTLDKNEENVAYQVLYNHLKLYKEYFEVYCNYYTTKNDRLKLLNIVNDCERYPEYAEFIVVIYESLVKCGLNRVNACRLLLKRVREKTIATSIVEALIIIIMKSDWTMFTDFIEKYTEDMYKFNFSIKVLESMAPAVLNSKGPHLKQVFGKCVQTLHLDDTGLLLNSPILIQCVALLTTYT